MTKSTRRDNSYALSWVLVLTAPSWAQTRHPKSNNLPKPMGWIPTGKLKRCASV